MKLFSLIALYSLCFLPSASGLAANNPSLDDYFAQLTPPEKLVFLKKFPKGGDIHFHLAGSASPETMLRMKSSFCINQDTLSAQNTKECSSITTKELPEHPREYEEIVEAWSMKNFSPQKESAHDHFFNTFLKFQPIIAAKQAELLSLLRIEADDQNISYLEPIITPDDNQALGFASLIKDEDNTNKAIDTLLSNDKFKQHVYESITHANKVLEKSNHFLSCPGKKGCEVSARFQYYILREQPFPNVIAQASAAFLAASESPSIVGINLVQAEDGVIALRDYKKHMALIATLKKRFPNVNVSLHAGELEPKTVSPEDLSFHIHDAITVAKANRIGHGTDIAYETGADKTLSIMKKKGIPVEINLSSNETILKVKGAMHPISLYLAKGVPVVLSTDDEGILRTTLTQEYFLAASRHHLSYSTLKNISRNSLTYSFLPGKSLWKSNQYKHMNAGCSLNNPTKKCLSFLSKNEKARKQFSLEKKFADFEKEYLSMPLS